MLPSDIARLVLMYLKDEGLTRSYQQFFSESTHLEELRCHPDVEPSVPYEKGLPEILNEYAKIINAIKDRLSCNQLVNSLWKMHTEVISQLKFQYTGNAGLLQTQDKRCINQRALSRHRLSSLRKQQELQRQLAVNQLTVTMPSSSPSCNSAVNTSQSQINSALNASHSAVNSYPATNSCYLAINSSRSVQDPTHSGVNSDALLRNAVSGSPVQTARGRNHALQSSDSMRSAVTRSVPGIEVEMQEVDSSRQRPPSDVLHLEHGQGTVPEQRTPAKSSRLVGAQQETPFGKSPKRKRATPRRLQGTMATTISPRSDTTSSANQWEDHEDGRDLPEVLESLIKNIEFQEKLAQNINKAIPLENVDKQGEPIKSADTSSSVDGQTSTSIEELLNLQMSDDTIHDIVQKTSSDPAFESLFSLFNQNSQDGCAQQLENHSNETPAASNDIMTDQSHITTNTAVGQVVLQAANQSCEATLSSTSSNSVTGNESRYAGELDSTNVPPAATSSFMTIAQHNAGSPLTTSSSSTQLSVVPSTDQVVTLPVLLNQSGPYQVMQQPNTGSNSQGIMVTSPASLPGATIFMSADGRILGTSGVISPVGQPLQASGVVQSVRIRQTGTQSKVSSEGGIHTATPSIPHTCPVHGTTGESTGRSLPSPGLSTPGLSTPGLSTPGLSTPGLSTPGLSTPGLSTPGLSTRSAVTPSTVAQSEVLQLLGSMVQSDVGSLFNGSPEISNPETPTSSKQTPKKAKLRKKGARSPKPPSISAQTGSQTLNRNNQNNNQTVGTSGANQVPCSKEIAVTVHSHQAINKTPTVFPAVAGDGQVTNPGLASGRRASQVSTSPEVGVPTTSPPVNSGKQRKQIQFKQVVLPRNLDVGGSIELPSKQTQQSPANASQRSRTTRAKRQGSNAQTMDPSRPSDSAVQETGAASANQPMVPASHSANPHARPVPMPSDMSAEVNIAAQMLVCLSNSPPSLRQSPNRLQRLRGNSGSSPARSPTRDHIVELRKEIGLSPRNHRLQRSNLTAATKSNLDHSQPPACSTDTNEVHARGRTSQDRLSNEQTQTKDASNSKRKSRTPRKQAHTVTETVVLTMPAGPGQKSSAASSPASAPSTIQTRAATLKSKSPAKLTNDPKPTRKSSRTSKSPGRPAAGVNDPGKDDSGKAVFEHSEEESVKVESRGQKRSREENAKEQSMKKPKTAKNSKKTKKSQGFPSNLDVDKFLSSLQYAE